jgi:acyl carrier protein
MKAQDIDNQAPLFGEGLGLDSLDAVELVMLLEKHFGVRITDSEIARQAFGSINTLLAFIENSK